MVDPGNVLNPSFSFPRDWRLLFLVLTSNESLHVSLRLFHFVPLCFWVHRLRGSVPKRSPSAASLLPSVAPNRVTPAAVKGSPDGGGRDPKKDTLIEKVTWSSETETILMWRIWIWICIANICEVAEVKCLYVLGFVLSWAPHALIVCGNSRERVCYLEDARGQDGPNGFALPGFHRGSASFVVQAWFGVNLIWHFIARWSELIGNCSGIYRTATVHPQVMDEWIAEWDCSFPVNVHFQGNAVTYEKVPAEIKD